MTRLETLCKLHGWHGGTIFQFNIMYDLDFLRLSDVEFDNWVKAAEYGYIKLIGAFTPDGAEVV